MTSPSSAPTLLFGPPSTAPPTPAAPIPPPQPTTSIHSMVISSKSGITRPRQLLNLSVPSSLSPIPQNTLQALSDPNWNAAMQAEIFALHSNSTWELVLYPPLANVIGSKWIYRHKFQSDGSLERYKAHLVAQGYTQQPGLDYDETFSPIVKPANIRTVLSLALSRSWPIHQLDVKNAFLHGHLNEVVFMRQPPSFIDSTFPTHICRLKKVLYGLKQAPHAWYHHFASFLSCLRFVSSKANTSIFVFRHGTSIAYLLLYVDDIVFTAPSPSLFSHITRLFSLKFPMTDLGSLHYFLGINVSRSPFGLIFSQSKFAMDILERAHMASCNPCKTPVDTSAKLSLSGPPVFDPTHYRSLAGPLQYLTITRPISLMLFTKSVSSCMILVIHICTP